MSSRVASAARGSLGSYDMRGVRSPVAEDVYQAIVEVVAVGLRVHVASMRDRPGRSRVLVASGMPN